MTSGTLRGRSSGRRLIGGPIRPIVITCSKLGALRYILLSERAARPYRTRSGFCQAASGAFNRAALFLSGRAFRTAQSSARFATSSNLGSMQVQCDRSGKIFSSVWDDACFCLLASAINSLPPPISGNGARLGLSQRILPADVSLECYTFRPSVRFSSLGTPVVTFSAAAALSSGEAGL